MAIKNDTNQNSHRATCSSTADEANDKSKQNEETTLLASTYSIEEMADRLAIYDLYERYIHATDDHQLDMLNNIFLPDTFFDMTSLNHGIFTWKGGMRDDYKNNWDKFAIYFHICGNIRITFDNEERTSAHVKSKTINPIGMLNSDGDIDVVLAFGGYSDTLKKTDAGWRITSRKWNTALTISGVKYLEGSGGTLEKR